MQQTHLGPLVSVVVPSFNHGEFIGRAVKSVADQTYKNLELVVVDDASTDGTTAILRELTPILEERFGDHLRLSFSDINQGAGRTINKGLRLAKGEFLTILNSDDLYANTRIRALVAAAPKNDPCWLFSRVTMIDTKGRQLDWGNPEALKFYALQSSLRNFPSVGFAFLANQVALSSGNLFFSRSLFEEVGGFRTLHYCHDWDFTLRCLLRAQPVFVDSALYFYRLHGANTFRKLAGVAEAETAEVLSSYFSAVRRGEYRNRLAPTPENWPRVFRQFVTRQGYEAFAGGRRGP